MLRLHTFGGCFLTHAGARVDALAGQRMALALLAVLAAAGQRGASRDALLAMFWPESDDRRARTSLKQLVHALRRRLPTPHAVLTVGELRLDPQLVSSDVADFRDALDRGDHELAVRLHAGRFLDGFYVRGADAFERWAAAERAALARDAARALEALAEGHAARGDLRGSVDWWRRLSDAEPLGARAVMGLARALDAAGERAEAIEQLRAYERRVRDELDDACDPAVRALLAELQRPPAAAPSLVAGAARAADARRTIAVLPFANTSGDVSDDHFSDGLTDELISVLGKVDGLRVVARTSAFALKGSTLGVRAIASTLNASAVLEGSVRRASGRLRVTTQLVDGADGAVLWAESYDRTVADVFAVQDEIARAIVGALRMRLGARTLPPAHAADLVAYELYLKGRYVQNARGDREGLLLAMRYLREAIDRDPAYARAYAALSDAHATFAVYGYGRAHTEFAAAKAAARRACVLDGALAEARAALGHALFVYDYDWSPAERELQQALTLDPGYTWTHLPYAICLQDQGRFAEAIAALEAARAVDPLAPFVSAVLGRVHVNARQPDRAVRALVEALELNPRFDLAHQQLGHAYLQLGRHAEALASLRQASALSGGRDAPQVAYALAVTGARAAASAMLRELLDSPADAQPPAFNVAMAYAGLGDADAAFGWLERGFEERGSFMDGVKVTPAFEPLHGDPRWSALLGRMGLAT